MKPHLNIKAKAIVLIALMGVVCAASGFYGYTRGLAPVATPLAMTPGVYPGASTYTVWNEDRYYYAKDAFGDTPLWGKGCTDASYVINSAIANAAGGSVYIKNMSAVLSSEIVLNQNVATAGITIYGDGQNSTYLNGENLPVYAVQIVDYTGGWVSNVVIRDIKIGGGIYVQNAQHITMEDSWLLGSGDNRFCFLAQGSVYTLKLLNNKIGYGDRGGLCLLASASGAQGSDGQVDDVDITDNLIYSCNNYHVLLQGCDATHRVYGVSIKGNWIEPHAETIAGYFGNIAGNGIEVFSCYSIAISDNHIAGTANKTCDLVRLVGTAGQSSAKISLSGNSIYATDTNMRYAIYSDYLLDSTITGNPYIHGVSGSMFSTNTWTTSIHDNFFQEAPTISGSGFKCSGNFGWETDNYGWVSGTSPIWVKSGLDGQAVYMNIVPTGDAENWHVGGVNSTGWYIYFSGGGSQAFYWDAHLFKP